VVEAQKAAKAIATVQRIPIREHVPLAQQQATYS